MNSYMMYLAMKAIAGTGAQAEEAVLRFCLLVLFLGLVALLVWAFTRGPR
jgi:hypothetical protein